MACLSDDHFVIPDWKRQIMRLADRQILPIGSQSLGDFGYGI